MDSQSNQEQPDLARQLTRDAYHQLILTLRAALSPVSDTPQDLECRDKAAVAQVAALLPANADEAGIAAQYVAAGAQALECLRLAREYHDDPTLILKCTARAAGMMREARALRSLLMRVQSARQKREADTANADARTEHCAIGWMLQALGHAAPIPIAEPAPPASAPEPIPDEAPTPDPVIEAEQYAVRHPQRAALIRTLGKIPDDVSFGPLDDSLVRSLITGLTPALLALDQQKLAMQET